MSDVDPEFALEVDGLVRRLLGTDPRDCEEARDRLLALGGFSHPYIRQALDQGVNDPALLSRELPAPLPRHGMLGGFVLGESVGRGGFAFVFRTRPPPGIDGPVCIKVGYPACGGSSRVTRLTEVFDGPHSQGISPDQLCADGLREDSHAAWAADVTGDEVRELLVEEARLLRAIEGDVFPGVHAMGEENGQAFYVMDLLEGPTLRELIRRGEAGSRPLLHLVARLCRELGDLHQLDPRFFHGDLKPENLVVQKDRLRALDPALRRERGRLRGTLTVACNPMALDGERADTCALAITLLEALGGPSPFRDWKQPKATARDATPELRRALLGLNALTPATPVEARLLEWIVDPPTYAEMDRGLRALA